MANPWEWDIGTHRYRNARTGRFLGAEQMVAMRDEFLSAQAEAARNLAMELVSQRATVQEWVKEMRTVLHDSYVDSYVAAHGGRGTMQSSDWGRLGQMLREQYAYLQNFAQEIAAGKYNPETAAQAIGYRSEMYVNSSNEAFNRGKGAGYSGMPALPAYPGDGSTACRTGCRCNWEIVETDTEWQASWQLGISEHCEDCLHNASVWNPLVLLKVA